MHNSFHIYISFLFSLAFSVNGDARGIVYFPIGLNNQLAVLNQLAILALSLLDLVNGGWLSTDCKDDLGNIFDIYRLIAGLRREWGLPFGPPSES